MFIMLKVSSKRRLIYGIRFNKLMWADLQFLDLDHKLFVQPVYWACWHEKRYPTLLERQFKLLGLMQYSLWIMKDLNFSVATICLHILHLILLHNLQKRFSFQEMLPSSHKNVFQTFSSFKSSCRNPFKSSSIFSV